MTHINIDMCPDFGLIRNYITVQIYQHKITILLTLVTSRYKQQVTTYFGNGSGRT
jgi:hypothetical protein